MGRKQIIAHLQQLWRRSITDEFIPKSEMISFWLNKYHPSIIRDAFQVLAKYLQTHKMPGDECIRYLGATMRNMRNQRGTADLARIVIGHSAPDPEHNDPIEDLRYDDSPTDMGSGLFGWPPDNEDEGDLTLD